MHPDDTIVAISSPAGAAPRGIVRLSGPRAMPIAAGCFASVVELSDAATPIALDGTVRVGRGTLPATAWIFRAPHSYTRQDLVELHLLGAPGVLGELVESFIATGARRAEPGEFTARAFLSGALDLAQVHGVAAMIAAQSDGQLRAARRLLEGALSFTAQSAREELADLLALVEGALDFADEPIEFIAPAELHRRLIAVAESLQCTIDAGLRAERWGRLPRILLAGQPNAGKSSLLNRLTGLDRAITTPIAGTTRDVLSAALALGDTECLLIDVAGLGAPLDSLDRAAQKAARAAVVDSDLVVWVIDGAAALDDIDGGLDGLEALRRNSHVSFIGVLNKIDLLPASMGDALAGRLKQRAGISIQSVSAATGMGCEAVKETLAALLAGRAGSESDTSIALLGEHHQALKEAHASLNRAIALAGAQNKSLADADFVALELHAAADALGTLVGRDVPDELLGRIFARFCVGK